MTKPKSTTNTAKTTKKATKTPKTTKTNKEVKEVKDTNTVEALGFKDVVNDVVNKVVETVKKIPAWISRLQSELKQLIERLNKLDAELDRLQKYIGEERTPEVKEQIRLLTKQRKAMVAYKDVLEERISKASK